MTLIRNEKDFWTGLIYVAFGAAVMWIAQDYPFGSAGRMGPGYFPTVLAGVQILLGIIALARSFIVPGDSIRSLAWKPLALILGATALFGLLVNTAGLVIALLALVLTSAAASEKFKFDWLALLGLVVLIAFCALVFVKGLGVPMPLFGPLLEPILGSRFVG
jgi:hypothetical protein